MAQNTETDTFLESNQSPKVKIVENGNGDAEDGESRKSRLACTWKCGLISGGIILVLVVAVLGMGYYRYVSKLTGKATSENSAEWEEKLSGNANLGNDSDITGMYELVSFDDTYDSYLLAMGTPSFVLSFVKMSSEVLTIVAPSNLESGTWKYHLKTDTRQDDWDFRLNEEFSIPWGRNKGFLHQICHMNSPSELQCDKEERKRGWKITSIRSFSDQGFIESLNFTSAQVATKKYYEKTSKAKLKAKKEDIAKDPDAPFSSNTDQDDDFWEDSW
ncbi:hypothetical protein TCAL_00622 [Tigriopus californicus]|uniref:Uncharacterized protein n=1 Tax=Tigriopus californicus TaxID=6832 RepID=A0A553PBK4_TIGCA|nr:uncharacterized protein LOC131877009 [Tigriopus californicus]XP_059078546.1 uncharacterized protein LOC131877009 [Tigriopus californicus]TRY75067.1 hypothetical protein TCAL_00622 [Tigriopus californicus]